MPAVAARSGRFLGQRRPKNCRRAHAANTGQMATLQIVRMALVSSALARYSREASYESAAQ